MQSGDYEWVEKETLYRVTIRHDEWLSTAGFKQEHDVIFRDGLELGIIGFSEWNKRFSAMLSVAHPYRSEYFITYLSAIKWINRETKYIRPISELNKYLV